MKLTIIRVIGAMLIAAALGLYTHGIIVNGDAPGDHLLGTIAIAISGVSVIRRTFPRRKPLSFYANEYPKELGAAFQHDAKLRTKLLEAVRLYNEEKNPQALRLLNGLQEHCRERDDIYAVGLFTALIQTDMGLFQAAVETYESMIARHAVRSQLYSNLGNCLSRLDEFSKACDALKKAIELDPQNALAHNNLGNLYFRHGDYAPAKACAEEALRINPATYQASTLLAILYAIEGDEAETERYYDMAVSAGQEPESLMGTIRYYQAKAQSAEA